MTPKEALKKLTEYIKLDEYDYETSGVGDAERLLVNALTELEELKSWRDELNETIQYLTSKAKHWEEKENKTQLFPDVVGKPKFPEAPSHPPLEPRLKKPKPEPKNKVKVGD